MKSTSLMNDRADTVGFDDCPYKERDTGDRYDNSLRGEQMPSSIFYVSHCVLSGSNCENLTSYGLGTRWQEGI